MVHIFYPLLPVEELDYRPVAQAAALAFMGATCLPHGAWDELSLWLGFRTPNDLEPIPAFPKTSLRLGNDTSWATLRSAHFHSRPAQADQLHVDIWWQGNNIALDAGTYRYTAPPPWDNRLSGTAVHNTMMVFHTDQMTHAGRFLWLDWAQATILRDDNYSIIAEHNGYRRMGITHRRTLQRPDSSHWLVQDDLLSSKSTIHQQEITLHWLLPDWDWQIENQTLQLFAPFGQIILNITSIPQATIQLVRAGLVVHGSPAQLPILGWYSPTYGHKIPALSLVYTTVALLPLKIISNWTLIGVK